MDTLEMICRIVPSNVTIDRQALVDLMLDGRYGID